MIPLGPFMLDVPWRESVLHVVALKGFLVEAHFVQFKESSTQVEANLHLRCIVEALSGSRGRMENRIPTSQMRNVIHLSVVNESVVSVAGGNHRSGIRNQKAMRAEQFNLFAVVKHHIGSVGNWSDESFGVWYDEQGLIFVQIFVQ